MRKLLLLASILCATFLFIDQEVFAQSEVCDTAVPICSGIPISFPIGTNSTAEGGPDYGCLASVPNPSWFYLEVATPGNMEFIITPSTPADFDFAIWGPFPAGSTVPDACNEIAFSSPADCSYAGGNGQETPQVPGGSVGDIYIMVVTNFENTSNSFGLNQIGSPGETDCSIVELCYLSLGELSVTPDAACPTPGTFTIEIPFTNDDGGGNATDGPFVITYGGGTLTNTGADPGAVTSGNIIVNVPASTVNSVNETITITGASECSRTVNVSYVCAEPCPVITSSTVTPGEACLGGGGTVTLAGAVDMGVEGTDYIAYWFLNDRNTPLTDANGDDVSSVGPDGLFGTADDANVMNYVYDTDWGPSPGACTAEDLEFILEIHCISNPNINLSGINAPYYSTNLAGQCTSASCTVGEETHFLIDLTNLPPCAELLGFDYTVAGCSGTCSGTNYGTSYSCESEILVSLPPSSGQAPIALCGEGAGTGCGTFHPGCDGNQGAGNWNTTDSEAFTFPSGIPAAGTWDIYIYDVYEDNSGGAEGEVNFVDFEVMYYVPPGCTSADGTVKSNPVTTSVMTATQTGSAFAATPTNGGTPGATDDSGAASGVRVCEIPVAGTDFTVPANNCTDFTIVDVCGDLRIGYATTAAGPFDDTVDPNTLVTPADGEQIFYEIFVDADADDASDCPACATITGSMSVVNCPIPECVSSITANNNCGMFTTAYSAAATGAGFTDDMIYTFDAAAGGGDLEVSVSSAAAIASVDWFVYNSTTNSYDPYAIAGGATQTGMPDGGYLAIITDAAGGECKARAWVWNITIEADAATTEYTICAGEDVDLSGTATTVTEDYTYYDPVECPEYYECTGFWNIEFTFSHSFLGDLEFYLLTPDGTQVDIAINASGGAGNNTPPAEFTYTFTNDGSGTGTLGGGSTGAFTFNADDNQVVQDALCLGGSGPNGEWDVLASGWAVQIYDCVGSDIGQLENAIISFDLEGDGTYDIVYDGTGDPTLPSAINDSPVGCDPATASIYAPPATTAVPGSQTNASNPGVGSQQASGGFEWTLSTAGATGPFAGAFDDANLTVNVSPTVDTWYQLQVTDDSGCTSEVVFTVNVGSQPVDAVLMQNDFDYCTVDPAETIMLDATTAADAGTETWLWFSGTPADPSDGSEIATGTSFPIPAGPGVFTYCVVGEGSAAADGSRCYGMPVCADVAITLSPQAPTTTPSEGCEGDAITNLTASCPDTDCGDGSPEIPASNETYNTDDGDITDNTPYIIADQLGITLGYNTTYTVPAPVCAGATLVSVTANVTVANLNTSGTGAFASSCHDVTVTYLDDEINGTFNATAQTGISSTSVEYVGQGATTGDDITLIWSVGFSTPPGCLDADPEPERDWGADISVTWETVYSCPAVPAVAGTPPTVEWYDDPTAGTLQFTGASFDPTGFDAVEGAFDADVDGTYTFYAACVCAGCPSTRTAAVYTVFDPVTVDAGPDQTICIDGTATMDATLGGSAASGSWTGGAGTFDVATSPTAVYTPAAAEENTTVTLTWTTDDPTGPCPAASDDVDITVDPLPVVDAGVDQTICSDGTATMASTITLAGAAYTGTWTTSGDGSFDSATSLAAVYTPGPTDSGTTVTLTLTSDDPAGPCGVIMDMVDITVNPEATADAGPDQAICEDATATMAAVAGGGSTTGMWSGGAGTFSLATDPAAVYTPAASEAGTVVTLTWTTDDPDAAGPCPAVSDDMDLTVDPAPVVDAGADQEICSDGTATMAGTITLLAAPYTGTWTTSGDGSFDTPTNLAAVYTPGPGDSGTTVTLTLTSDDPDGECGTYFDTVDVAVVTKPDPPANPAIDPFCEDLTPYPTITPGAGVYNFYRDGVLIAVTGDHVNSYTLVAADDETTITVTEIVTGPIFQTECESEESVGVDIEILDPITFTPDPQCTDAGDYTYTVTFTPARGADGADADYEVIAPSGTISPSAIVTDGTAVSIEYPIGTAWDITVQNAAGVGTPDACPVQQTGDHVVCCPGGGVTGAQDICDNDVPDLRVVTNFTTPLADDNGQLNTTDANNGADTGADGVSWFLGNDPFGTAYSDAAMAAQDACTEQTYTLYAFLQCDKDGDLGSFDPGAFNAAGLYEDEWIPAGAIDVTVWPEIDGSTAFPDAAIGLECRIEVFPSCDDFVIDWVTDDVAFGGASSPPALTGPPFILDPDQVYAPAASVGTADFTITNPNAPTAIQEVCVSIDLPTVEYTCCIAEAGYLEPGLICPPAAGDPAVSPDNDLVVEIFDFENFNLYSTYLVVTDANDIVLDIIDLAAPPALVTVAGDDNTAAGPMDGMATVTFNYDYWGFPTDVDCTQDPGYDRKFYVYNEFDNVPATPGPAIGSDVTTWDATSDICGDLSDPRDLYIPAPFTVVSGVQNDWEGNEGGVIPFYYNYTTIEICGGSAPYTYSWDREGYVRHAIVGVGLIRIIYADEAEWSVTVSDSNVCSDELIVFSNNQVTNPILDIESYTIVGDNKTTLTSYEGEIAIEVTGGDTSCGDYTYEWSGPLGYTSSGSATIAGLRYGWYTVTVTDCAGDTTTGWYWVPYTTIAPGSTGTDRGKLSEQAGMVVYPNPLADAATIDFSINETANATVELYTIDGMRILEVFRGIIDGGAVVSIPFEAGPLTAGMYIMKLRTDKGEELNEKVILTK